MRHQVATFGTFWLLDELASNYIFFYFSQGDQEASFTKDDMQQGKHQEYERKLHEQLQSQTGDT